MPDEPRLHDPGSVWRNQPVEKVEINLNRFVARRSRELQTKTRAEILLAIAATLFFVAVFTWRLPVAENRASQVGFVLALAWILISAYWFRHRIWRRAGPQADTVASASLDYYRRELQRRRDHLRNAWLWYGPLLLACILTAVSLGGKALNRPGGLWNVAPFALSLVVWVVLGWVIRRRQVREMQDEIDELSDT